MSAALAGFPILSAIWLAPFLAGIALMFAPASWTRAPRMVALAASAVSLALTVALLFAFDYRAAGALQFQERWTWIADLGVEYRLGVDGISLLMVALNAAILFSGVLASWGLRERSKEFFVLLLLLGGGVFGVFTAFNLYLFFALYEIAVLPMYLLIGVWGTGPKEYSAMKLTLMLMGGSAFLLLGILALYFGSTPHSLDIPTLQRAAASGQFGIAFQRLWFPVLFLGFAVLAALWPFHTWSPDGHASAPTAVSMLHAGVLMKLGAYGCLRVAIGLLPQGAHLWAPAVAALALVNVVYGSIGAASQTDLKYVTAYSSVSHMGMVLLGLATLGTLGLSGAVLQMFAHGLMTGVFFALIGLTYGRTHTRHLPSLGGLARVMPFVAAAYVVAGMAGLGLPGLSSFPAELLVFLGAFLHGGLFFRVVGVAAVSSIVFTALYVLRVLQKAFYGPITEPKYLELKDATFVERVPVVFLLSIMVVVGLWPFPVLRLIDGALAPLVQALGGLPR